MNWVQLFGLAVWASGSSLLIITMGVSMFHLTKMVSALKERLRFFEKSHREVANIRQTIRSLNEDRQKLKDVVKALKKERGALLDRIMDLEESLKKVGRENEWLEEVLSAYKSLDREEEVKWLKEVLEAHGLGHILQRDLTSPLWEITGCPKPPTKK